METSRSAEPLQSLSSQHNSRHRSVNNNDSNKKKKKRRRRRRRTPKMESGNDISNNDVALGRATTSCDKSWTLKNGPPTPVLRPVGAQVPRAPENSTQFIMDDHENSALFVNFDNQWEQEPPTSGGEGEDDPAITPSGTPTHPLNRDWFPFNVTDFENAYQSAREDKLMAGSSADLRAAIVALEARAAVLTDALSASPSRLLSTLQSHLLRLQEENAALRFRLNHYQKKEQRTRKQQASSSSSSTDSDSESDSTNSSSDCSESDCDTCAARRGGPASDEEKENTRPSHSSTPGQLQHTTAAP